MLISLSYVVAAVALAAPAKQDLKAAPEVAAISACRAVADAAARLACFDQAVGALDTALANQQLTVLTRNDVRQTKRSLFGFSIPKLPFFGGKDDGEPDIKQVTAKVAGLRSLGYGKWQVRLEDGAVWQTIEPFASDYEPRSGSNVTIKQGMLGNYFLAFSGVPSVRGRRVS